MSIVKDLKNAQTKLAAQTAEIEELRGKLEAVETEAAEADAAHISAQADMQAEHEQAVETLKNELAVAAEQQTEMAAQVETLTAERDGAVAELAQAKTVLKNPAFADAAATGEAEAVETDGESPESATETTHGDTYLALQKDGRHEEATAYWNEHEDEIRKGL